MTPSLKNRWISVTLLAAVGGLLVISTLACSRGQRDSGSDGTHQQHKLEDEWPSAPPVTAAETVEAINIHRKMHGHWPIALDDLETLPENLKDYKYTVVFDRPSDPRWVLEIGNGANSFHYRYTYQHITQSGVWDALIEGQYYQVGQPAKLVECRPLSRSEIAQEIRQLRALQVHRPQCHNLYQKAIIELYFDMEDFDSAAKECLRFSQETTDLWATCKLSFCIAKASPTPDKIESLPVDTLCQQFPAFQNHVIAASIYRQCSQPTGALRHLRAAFARPQPREPDDDELDYDYWYWCAAWLAWQLGDMEFVLTVTDSWEQWRKLKGYGDASFLLYRAAALLQLHRFVDAQTLVRDNNLTNAWRGVMWAQQRAELVKAITASDASYKYDPGNYPRIPDYRFHMY
jgi:hypothetical protein